MIYEFLYKSKPVNLFTPIIPFLIFLIFLGFFIYFYRTSHPQKQEPSTSTTYRYDPELRKHVAISTTTTKCPPEPLSRDIIAGLVLSFLLSIMFGIATLMTSAISIYDYTTTPNKNTKTTELYLITKENDYLTFTAKKPYNHLYNSKTIKITYEDAENYVIIKNEQIYKITKKDITQK